MSFIIVSDSANDLDDKYLKENEIRNVSFYININEKEFLRDRIDIKSSELMEMLRKDKNLYPKTSQPNAEDYYKVFEPLAKEGHDILCFTISDSLSGSFQSANIARDEINLEYNVNIKIINTKAASLATGIMIDQAVELRDKGYSIDKTYETIEKLSGETSIYIVFDSLDYLEKGGRISKTKKRIGSFFGLKPIVSLKDNSLAIVETIRGSKKAFNRSIELLKKDIEDSEKNYKFFVAHGDNLEGAEYVKERIKTEIGADLAFDIEYISPVLISHTGPGVVGFGFVEAHSL